MSIVVTRSTRSRYGLDLRQVEAEEHVREHLLRDRAGRFDRQREIAGEEVLRAAQLRGIHGLALQPEELVDHQPQRLAGRGRPRVGLGDDVAARLVRVEIRRCAVGQAAIGSQHAEQPVRALAAENPDRQVERHVVRVRARHGDVADADLRLRRAGPIDHDDAPRRRRRIDRLERRNVAALPSRRTPSRAAANASSAVRSPTIASSALFGHEPRAMDTRPDRRA